MSAVIDFYEAVSDLQRRKAPCPEAYDWVQAQGHDPMVFSGNGLQVHLSESKPDQFERFTRILDLLPHLGGQYRTEDAVSFVVFDIGPGEDLVSVYHEMLGIDPFPGPRIYEVASTGRRIVVATCDMDQGGLS